MKLPLAVALAFFAASAGETVLAALSDSQLAQLIPVCSEKSSISRAAFDRPLPPGFKAELIAVKSEKGLCDDQQVAVITPSQNVFLGNPWFLSGIEGAADQKLRQFAWDNFRETYTVSISPAKNGDGLQKVVLTESADGMKINYPGLIDPAGSVFFPGRFEKLSGNAGAARVEVLGPVTKNAPSRGNQTGVVTVIEFSDFQCPSCKWAATNLHPVMEKQGAKVRHVRIDLPLMSSHPWALFAALSGRAIHRQDPAAFWKFKSQVYDNQDRLNTFTIGDFASNFVKDHELSLEKFKSDVESESLRSEIAEGMSLAFALQIHGTPTFLVNGVRIDPGSDGAGLSKAIESALAAATKSSGVR